MKWQLNKWCWGKECHESSKLSNCCCFGSPADWRSLSPARCHWPTCSSASALWPADWTGRTLGVNEVQSLSGPSRCLEEGHNNDLWLFQMVGVKKQRGKQAWQGLGARKGGKEGDMLDENMDKTSKWENFVALPVSISEIRGFTPWRYLSKFIPTILANVKQSLLTAEMNSVGPSSGSSEGRLLWKESKLGAEPQQCRQGQWPHRQRNNPLVP